MREIIRMQPPDFRPQTIEIDLASALAGDETIPLQQFDTVWIFGRYEIDAPKVRIYGEVLRPGEYPMSSGMTAAALVKMAGGFRRGAFTETADLASYEMQNGLQVVTNQQTIRIGGAVAGILQPMCASSRAIPSPFCRFPDGVTLDGPPPSRAKSSFPEAMGSMKASA